MYFQVLIKKKNLELLAEAMGLPHGASQKKRVDTNIPQLCENFEIKLSALFHMHLMGSYKNCIGHYEIIVFSFFFSLYLSAVF